MRQALFSPHETLPATGVQNNAIASWPSAPHPNKFIDQLVGALEACGWAVRDANPSEPQTPWLRVRFYLLHWPDALFWDGPSSTRLFLRIVRVLCHLGVLRLRGTRLIWFVHNQRPHDLAPARSTLWRFYAGMLVRLADGWVTMAPSTAAEIVRAMPGLAKKPQTHFWIPTYPWAFPVAKADARRGLGLSNEDLLFAHIGLLRPYKGLDGFARIFADWAPGNTGLLLAGRAPSPDYSRQLEQLAQSHGSIDLRLGDLADDTFNRLLRATDIFVAPYTSSLHSAAIVHALCRGCIVLVRRNAFSQDLQSVAGEDWVILYDDEVTTQCLDAARLAAGRVRADGPDLSALAPLENGERLNRFLRALD